MRTTIPWPVSIPYFMRGSSCRAGDILMPLASAAYAPDPKPCLNIVLDGAKVVKK